MEPLGRLLEQTDSREAPEGPAPALLMGSSGFVLLSNAQNTLEDLRRLDTARFQTCGILERKAKLWRLRSVAANGWGAAGGLNGRSMRNFEGAGTIPCFTVMMDMPLHFGQKLQNIQLKGRDPHKTMDF